MRVIEKPADQSYFVIDDHFSLSNKSWTFARAL